MEYTLILIIWLHFVADFLLQPDWMATRKSSNTWILALHCLVYGAIFVLIGWAYAAVNGLLHFAVDFVTSRLTSHFYETEGYGRKFFNAIGLDQAIHMTILYLTYVWLVR